MSSFWKHVSSVFAGTLFAQLIPIIGSLFITRIFAPSEYGAFSTWLAIVSLMTVVVTLRLEPILAIVDDGVDRTKAVFVIALTTLVAAAVLALCLIVLNRVPAMRYYLPEQTMLIALLVPAALLTALTQVWQSWAAADGMYGELNTMRLVQALAVVIIQIGAGLKYPNAVSLTLGFVAAAGISYAWAVLRMPKFIRREFLNWAEIKKFFNRYKNFPLYALPADSINTAAAQLPVLVVSYRFGHETAGYLALTMRTLGAPIGLVAKSILDVFKRYAILNIKQSGNCRNLYINTFIALALASLIMALGTLIMAKDVFDLAFGHAWTQSGIMAIWLLPMFAMRLIASPLSYMCYLVEKMHIDMWWQTGLIVVTFATLYGFDTVQSTLMGYGVACAVMYTVYVVISYRLSCGTRIKCQNR